MILLQIALIVIILSVLAWIFESKFFATLAAFANWIGGIVFVTCMIFLLVAEIKYASIEGDYTTLYETYVRTETPVSKLTPQDRILIGNFNTLRLGYEGLNSNEYFEAFVTDGRLLNTNRISIDSTVVTIK